MKHTYLTDDNGCLKQNILIKNEEIETVTYIDNLRICDVFNKEGNWKGYNVFFVKYVGDFKITEEIKPKDISTKQNKREFSQFCKGYVDLNELEKRMKSMDHL